MFSIGPFFSTERLFSRCRKFSGDATANATTTATTTAYQPVAIDIFSLERRFSAPGLNNYSSPLPLFVAVFGQHFFLFTSCVCLCLLPAPDNKHASRSKFCFAIAYAPFCRMDNLSRQILGYWRGEGTDQVGPVTGLLGASLGWSHVRDSHHLYPPFFVGQEIFSRRVRNREEQRNPA